MEIPHQLINAISRKSERTASPAVRVLIDEILARHGEAARGVLFYGSCLRSGDDLDGLVDLYLLVDGYRAAYKSRIQAISCHWRTFKKGPPCAGFIPICGGGFVSRLPCSMPAMTMWPNWY